MKHSTQASGAPRVIISLAVAAAIIIGAIAGATYFLAVKAPLAIVHGAKEESFDTAHRVADGFKSVFNFTPQITVNGTTVVEQANSVMELATVRQGVDEHYQWSQSWFGSRKTMVLEGVYEAKAGFDLHDSVRITMEGNRITAILPAPKLLSLEMNGYKVLMDDNGWWNKINSADRENAIAAMQEDARSKATQSGILEEAKAKFKEQLSQVIKAQNITTPVETRFQDEAPVQIAPQDR